MTLKRAITRDDIMPMERYAAERKAQRKRVTELKRDRRAELGPYCTFYFENFDTMWLQVQEMLHIEHGGETQLAEELEAYNPLIPQGDELSATVMFEIEDPERRTRMLSRLGGVEDAMYFRIAGETVRGIPDGTRENTSPEGKASSVQFVRFPFSAAQKAAFKAPGAEVILGIDHPNYRHMAVLPEPVRAALAGDLD